MRDVQNFAILTVSAMERKNARQVSGSSSQARQLSLVRERAGPQQRMTRI